MSEKKQLENGSWAEWRRLVLSELNRLNSEIEEVKKTQQQIEIQIATQNTKLVMIGTIGTIIIGIATSLLTHYLTK